MENYRIIRKLSESSTSCVSLAESLISNQFTLKVVIKEIYFDPRISLLDRKQVLNESKVLASLSHPNIIKLLDTFMTTSAVCIVTEYCEGGDLSRLVRFNECSIKDIQEIFIQLLLALKYLHDMNILHRDLKLRNIFISSRSGGILRVKIGDFGIARSLETSQMATTMVGTPYYLSPELCAKQPYDKSIDVWSLGCVLYELLNSGRHPFNAKNLSDLLGRIQEEPIDYGGIKDLRMVEMLRRMLCKDPKERLTIDGILYLPLIQEFIQDFVTKINTQPSTTLTSPPLSHHPAFSSTAELVNTMQTFIATPPTPLNGNFYNNPLDNNISHINDDKQHHNHFKIEFKTKFDDQLKQASQCCRYIQSTVAKDSLRLQKEANRLHQRLSQLLILPSKICRFLEILDRADFDGLEGLIGMSVLKDILDEGLVGDAIVMQEIQRHL